MLVLVQPASAQAGAATETAGALLRGDSIMLANLDDDEGRCRVDEADLDRPGLEVDHRLAACHDAADERVNGRADEDDLARVRIVPRPWLGPGASGVLRLDDDSRARVFLREDGRFRPLAPGDGVLTAAQLRSGAELGIEGRDIVRDRAEWDGVVTLVLEVTDGNRAWQAQHRIRVAPLLLQNDLQRAVTVFAGRPGAGPGLPDDGAPLHPPPGVPGEWEPFAGSLGEAARKAGSELRFITGSHRWWKDVWWQDLFEPAVASMPARHGVQTMRVAIRSANLWDLAGPDGTAERTLRPAGRLLFRDLRGPDVAVVQEFTDEGRDFGIDLRNATGNFETLPPYAGHPQGRVLYGSAPPGSPLRPDPAFVRLLDSQGQQPPVVLDTSWLAIGHVDETTHVVRAGNDRGWTVMVADPRQAVELLREARRQGGGQTRLFADTNSPERPTVDELLGDPGLLADNEFSAGKIDAQIEVLLAETGLRAEELVRVPVLFKQHNDYPLMIAYTPGIPNGLSLTSREFAAPDPHGPEVGGRDLFQRVTEEALARNGVRVRWVEDFYWAHLAFGEVHCVTNAWRDTSGGSPWWLTGA
ncbi:hypothetical protein A4R43_12550 [Amycolatopsis albispora]|uniref:Protein-arginine deiminase C-terminal domain-containing protein n=1 Tax=Amycolatopsis albispora TaxID=1804986 RepID=A0A344L5F6_9PSEU|nr:hypothetical protein A4R43_12550 [Amycolatopsis albispora]